MTRHAMLFAALVLAVPAAAQDSPQTETTSPAEAPPREAITADPEPKDFDLAAPEAITAAPEPKDFDLAVKKAIDCAGEKFVFAWGAGAKPTRVTLCSDKGATPPEVITMLEEAAAKLERTTSIPEDRRLAIVQQIRAKIAELQPASAAAAAPAGGAQLTSDAPPSAATIPPAAAPPARSAVLSPDVYKPLPPAPVRPLPAKPRLAFECITPGEFAGGGPCVTLTRDTILVVESGEALSGVALRFDRRGEARAEVALGSMRKGQSRRLAVPRQVCSGVVTSEVDVRIVRAGQVVDSTGPFLLRC